MIRMRLIGAVLLLTGGLAASSSTHEKFEKLWHFRNLGKAFYENPTTQFQAVEMFEKALQLAPDSPRERLNFGLALLRAGRTEEAVAELQAVQERSPDIPHSWFNLGIFYKKEAQYEEAVEQFKGMVRLVPDEPISQYNLGVVLRLTGDQDSALKHFERAAEIDPNMAGPFFQMYNAYRAQGRKEEAARALATFQKNKRRQAGAAIPEDLDWSFYSEILDEVEPIPAPELDNYESRLSFSPTPLSVPWEGNAKGLLVLDREGKGMPTLVAWSDQAVYAGRLQDGSSLEAIASEESIRSVVAGDFDNDGLQDLCLVSNESVVLWANEAGTFSQKHELAGSNGFVSALWFDFDHDADLDLFLFGGSSTLFRNNGGSGFAEAADLFPFEEGDALGGAVIDLIKDTNGTDLVVLYQERPAVLYRDLLAGKYESRIIDSMPGGSRRVWARDINNDGWTDLAFDSPAGLKFLLNTSGVFRSVSTGIESVEPIVLADLCNRGYPDVIVGSEIYQNDGMGGISAALELEDLSDLSALTAVDLDFDGRVDLAALKRSGDLVFLRNQSTELGNWISIGLQGVRNPKLAPGAEVEVKSASLYQKKIYEGLPLHFGLSGYDAVDTVRITWPNGLIQNEPQQPVGKRNLYQEKQRLSGSCPMVFTWNGSEFEFITDVLAVAPLGVPIGDGEYFPVDHDEYVQIDGSSLVADESGLLEIRITEELREVAYLDQIKLLAVDRPSKMRWYTSEKFKSPPFPEFRLYGVDEPLYPVSVTDHRGADVKSQVLSRDRVYPSNFDRDYLGVAELHWLDLDFGAQAAPDNRAILVLHGWVDFADGSTILKLSQDTTTEFVMPYLQVRDERGEWVTVVEDMGVPAGKPKTIVVDLTDRFLSSNREVRIVTNLCVYWDEIFLSADTKEPNLQLTPLILQQATLVYRGFSTPVIHPERLQPEHFEYARWMPVSMWNPAKGYYTRYGEVDRPIQAIDDRFVIMGPGDELRLLFEGWSLPPVPRGFTRDFLLFVDGWEKDGDLNTSFSQTVEPLPFHGMSSYPYPAGEHYPDSEEHRRYREEFNTRPALRLLRPLDELNSLETKGD